MTDARTRSGGALARWVALGVVRFLLVPLLLASGVALGVITATVHTSNLLYDFKGGLWNAGVAILQGHNPYQAAFLAHQAALMRAGHIALGETSARPFSVPVYPAGANVAVVPLSLLPLWLAGSLYTVASIAAMLAGVWLMGVRDRRCLALVVISWPFVYGLYLGTVGPFLVLGAGIAWRWRQRLWAPALGLASIVALKIFPWTLACWLWVTGRRRAFWLAVGVCAAITFGSWAAIGFDGLLQYPRMLSEVSYLQAGRADSLATGLLVAGVSPGIASALVIALAFALLVLAWRVKGMPDGDGRAFGLAVIAALTGTPIVWEHYMVLIFIPVAILSPRWSRLWLVPALLPVIELLSPAVIPDATGIEPYSPNALRGVLPWLAFEALLVVALTTTPVRRAAWRDALARRIGRRRALAAA